MGSTQLLFALANFVLCLAVVWMCLCRLNSMTRAVLYRVRSEYSLYLTCALASALQPMWGEWPEWGSLAMAVALIFGILASRRAWARGAPRSATTLEG